MRVWFGVLMGLLVGLGGGIWATSEWMSTAPLPIPIGASSEIQQAIEEAGPPNLLARSLVPQTKDQWRLVIEQADWARSEGFADFAESLGVTVVQDEIDGVPVHRVLPEQMDPELADQLFVYLHGGAYVFGGGEGGVREAVLISAFAGMPVVSVDYRMPPDHPHPAAVDDVEGVYRALLSEYSPSELAMGGTSAGGGLAMASIHRFKDRGLPLPAALYVGTPWADIGKNGDTLYTMEGVDRILGTYDGFIEAAAILYAGETDLKDPLVSPVYGDFEGFPPAYLVTGTRDMLLSDTARVAQKMRVAGIEVELIVFEGLSHAEYAFVQESPEFEQTYGGLAEFLRLHLNDADQSSQEAPPGSS